MKERLPTIGGIIAVLNQVEFITEAVESLLPQVSQLTVVDDGSTDGTRELLEQLTQQAGSRLRLISLSENVGVSNAFNIAAEATPTDILLIQGGDDISLPHRARVQQGILSQGKVMACFTQPLIIDGSGHLLPSDYAPEFVLGNRLPIEHDDLFYNGNFICAPSVAIWRSEYVQLGGFDPASRYSQDYLLWLKAASKGPLTLSRDPIVKYRKHTSNLSRQTQIGQERHTVIAVDLAKALLAYLSWTDLATLKRLCIETPVAAELPLNAHRGALELIPLMYHAEPTVAKVGWQAAAQWLAGQADRAASLRSLGLNETDFRIGEAHHNRKPEEFK